jgi:hypothetical protein
MFQGMHLTLTTRSASCPGNRHFVKANGSLKAGHFKSLLPQNMLNSSSNTKNN